MPTSAPQGALCAQVKGKERAERSQGTLKSLCHAMARACTCERDLAAGNLQPFPARFVRSWDLCISEAVKGAKEPKKCARG